MVICYMRCFMVLQYLTVVTAVRAQLLPPRNLSYVWIDDFNVRLSWLNPENSGDCQGTIRYEIQTTHGTSTEKNTVTRTEWEYMTQTEKMGSTGVHFSIKATSEENTCQRSTAMNQTIKRPVLLVEDFKCYLYSNHKMNCSWIPSNQVPDLQFFYRPCVARSEDFLTCAYSLGDRSGCELRVKDIRSEICVLLNGTRQGSYVRNTFIVEPKYNVTSLPPRPTIEEKEEQLIITWMPPDISDKTCWNYYVYYSKCHEPQKEEYVDKEFLKLPYNKDCQYTVKLQSIFTNYCGAGRSDISKALTYGVNKEPDSLMIVVIMIIIPIALSSCIIIVGCCFRRYRIIIFPVVPDPSVIFKEMMMGNSYEQKERIQKVYVPANENVDLCQINLVTDDNHTFWQYT